LRSASYPSSFAHSETDVMNPSAFRRILSIGGIVISSLLGAQSWQQLPSFPGTPRDDAASFVIGDHIYVGTGMEVGWGLTNDWYRFDMISETWEEVPAMPASPRQYCATFTYWDTAYVFGGIDGDGALDELWSYSSSTGWLQKASLPSEARYACVGQTGHFSGVIATGMLASGTPTNEAWKYWPSTDTWEQLTDVPGPPRHRAASTPNGGGMLICGGADPDFNALDDCWSYPLWFEVGEWFEAGSLPASRYGHRGAGLGVWIGGASDTFDMHDDVWNLSNWGPEDLPAFTGGARRGGIGHGRSGAGATSNTLYFGLGIGPEGGDFIRHNDWWILSYATSIADHQELRFTLHPNPATDRITLDLPAQWNNASLIIVDAVGRTVMTSSVTTDRQVNTGSLSPGRYELFIHSTDQRTLRAPLIKLE
jgi:hypothetical protein